MTFAVDLCAGAGGLSLGLQRAGFDVLGVEIDADACATHRANVGACEQASIVDWHPPRAADLVGGGVPCQGYSVAGKRGGSEMWREVIRIGAEAGARALIIENVRGMLSWKYDDGWSVVARIEQGMREAGYEPRRALLCAADFGTPQIRYRLIVLGFREPSDVARFRWPEPTHAERHELFGLLPWVTVREALGLRGFYRAGLKDGADPASPQGMRYLNVDKPAPTVAHVGELLSVLDRPAHTVAAGGTTTGGAEPFANADYRAKLSAAGLPRLSLADRSALQGFPPGFVWHGETAGSRDRQCGNAVPPQLGEAVGRSIMAALS